MIGRNYWGSFINKATVNAHVKERKQYKTLPVHILSLRVSYKTMVNEHNTVGLLNGCIQLVHEITSCCLHDIGDYLGGRHLGHVTRRRRITFNQLYDITR